MFVLCTKLLRRVLTFCSPLRILCFSFVCSLLLYTMSVLGELCCNFGLQCSVANLCADAVNFYKWNTFTWKDDSKLQPS